MMTTRGNGEQEPQAIAEMVAHGAIAIRVQNDSMLSAALARPRSIKDVIRRAVEELEADPDEAQAARYSLPFADRRRDEGESIARVEGLSINAAMALARNWGNCSVGANVLNQDAEGYDLEGYFIDLETNFRVSRPFRVSRFLKTRKHGIVTLDPQRMVMALQAGASKALRNAALAGLPPALKNRYERRAIEIAAGGDPEAKADEKTAAKVVDRFRVKYEIQLDKLEAYLGREADMDGPLPRADWKGRHVADLTALGTSIRDGQVKIEDVFAEHKKPGAVDPGAPGSKLDALAREVQGSAGKDAGGDQDQQQGALRV